MRGGKKKKQSISTNSPWFFFLPIHVHMQIEKKVEGKKGEGGKDREREREILAKEEKKVAKQPLVYK